MYLIVHCFKSLAGQKMSKNEIKRDKPYYNDLSLLAEREGFEPPDL
jgi:hypothetical protein